jgi:predicted nucleic acid-binding protein
VIYVDTSAVAKLVKREPESDALSVFLVERIGSPLVSSVLLYPELMRAVTRHRPDLEQRAVAVVQRVMQVPLSQEIVYDAATVGTPLLRTLDALHLATAATIAEQVEGFLTYDIRLAEAATKLGFEVHTPA